MDEFIGLIAIVSIFIVLPAMFLHYITEWRKMKSLRPDDERMLEDLWRSAKRMERRIETLETLLGSESSDSASPTADEYNPRRYDQ